MGLYDTVMIKVRLTAGEGGQPRDTQLTEDQRAPILLANNPHFRVSFGSLTVKASCLQTDQPHGEVWTGIVQKTAVYKYFTQITNC